VAVILPDAPGVIRLVHRGDLQGITYVNTMHILGSQGSYSQNDMQAIASAAHLAYSNAFIPQLNTGTSLQSTKAIDLTSRTAYWGEDTTPHTGTNVATVFPANSVAYCISWNIHDRYRGGHPRLYLPGCSTTDFTVGRTLTNTKAQALDTAAQGYLTSLAAITTGGQTFLPVCVRYYSQHQLVSPPYIRQIYDSTVHHRIDSMRRRTGKEQG
jgi:hypothetical protein